MSGILHARTAALVAVACLIAGCAAGGATSASHRAEECPPGYALSCKATRSSAGTSLSDCRCARHADISKLLRRDW